MTVRIVDVHEQLSQVEYTSLQKWWCHHSQRCNHKIVKYEDKRNALALPKCNTCIHHQKKCEEYCHECQSVVYPSCIIYALILLLTTPFTDDLWCTGQWISDPMKSYTLIISFVQKYIISTLNRFSTKTELSIPRFICRSFDGNKFPYIFGFLKDLSIVRGKSSYHLMAQFNAVSSDSIDNNDKEKPPL